MGGLALDSTAGDIKQTDNPTLRGKVNCHQITLPSAYQASSLLLAAPTPQTSNCIQVFPGMHCTGLGSLASGTPRHTLAPLHCRLLLACRHADSHEGNQQGVYRAHGVTNFERSAGSAMPGLATYSIPISRSADGDANSTALTREANRARCVPEVRACQSAAAPAPH